MKRASTIAQERNALAKRLREARALLAKTIEQREKRERRALAFRLAVRDSPDRYPPGVVERWDEKMCAWRPHATIQGMTATEARAFARAMGMRGVVVR